MGSSLRWRQISRCSWGWRSRLTNRRWCPTTRGWISSWKAISRRFPRLEQQGLQVFQGGRSQCTQCHQGAEFTAASFSNSATRRRPTPIPTTSASSGPVLSPLLEDPGLRRARRFRKAAVRAAQARAAGTFKSPGLRNVEFTGPYFHNGGQATLEQVVQFYARNGDFPAGGNLGPGIGQIALSPADQTALVAFLKSLSDDRVRLRTRAIRSSLAMRFGGSR